MTKPANEPLAFGFDMADVFGCDDDEVDPQHRESSARQFADLGVQEILRQCREGRRILENFVNIADETGNVSLYLALGEATERIREAQEAAENWAALPR